jgi:hypothetical protein
MKKHKEFKSSTGEDHIKITGDNESRTSASEPIKMAVTNIPPIEEIDDSTTKNADQENSHVIPDYGRLLPSAGKEEAISETIIEEQSQVRIDPIKYGGPPRGGRRTQKKQSEISPPKKVPQISIMCWKEGFNWKIGAEIDDDIWNLEVSQTGETLERKSSDENIYLLKSLTEPINVRSESEEKSIKIFSHKRDYLIFKMLRNWTDPGRSINTIGDGYYLIVAPNKWSLEENTLEYSPVEPEEVDIEGYKAFFVYKEQKILSTIGMKNEVGFPIYIETKVPQFKLVGRIIIDAAEEMGPIFADAPPGLAVSGPKRWKDVSSIVIGEEGRGRNKWRMSMPPDLTKDIQVMPEQLELKNGGWYFIRIYGFQNDLLESLDFRFMKGFYDIQVSPYSPLPDEQGHQPVTVSFLYKKGLSLEIEKGSKEGLNIQANDNGISVKIPNEPSWDFSNWVLGSGDSKIEIEILIERIWWDLIEDSNDHDQFIPHQFLDTPILLSRKSLQPTSNEALSIWLPRPRWAREVLIGSEKKRAGKYNIKTSERKVVIPLRDFSDLQEMNDPLQEINIKLWLSDEIYRNREAIIATFSKTVQRLDLRKNLSTWNLSQKDKSNPHEIDCCCTCDHARIKDSIYWCRRNHWNLVEKHRFYPFMARHKCPEWRGEYYDVDGRYHDN